jgi:hypothetical protein
MRKCQVSVAFLPAVLALCAVSGAKAEPITVLFEADSVQTNPSTGPPAPTNPVIGTIVYDAASTTSNINSLISINLTIDGHAYTLGEVGFAEAGVFQEVGGVLNGVNTLDGGTNDFLLQWTESNFASPGLIYTVAGPASLAFSSFTFSQFEVTATPEPSSVGLVLLGACWIWMRARKRRVLLSAYGRAVSIAANLSATAPNPLSVGCNSLPHQFL